MYISPLFHSRLEIDAIICMLGDRHSASKSLPSNMVAHAYGSSIFGVLCIIIRLYSISYRSISDTQRLPVILFGDINIISSTPNYGCATCVRLHSSTRCPRQETASEHCYPWTDKAAKQWKKNKQAHKYDVGRMAECGI